MNEIVFWKYQGTGNDFVMVDNRNLVFDKSVFHVKKLCDRRFGIGADGLICIENASEADFRMVYFNSDGNESTFCGNGGRCVVAFAKQLGIIGDQTRFVAKDGIHEAQILGREVRLKMIDVAEIKTIENGYELFTGSPHFVALVENVLGLDVKAEGAVIRYSDSYAKEGINVNFMEQKKDRILVRTYERGVEDETYSCGTGVTASALVAATLGMTSPVAIETPGGKLSIEFTKLGESSFSDIYLKGPADLVFEGKLG